MKQLKILTCLHCYTLRSPFKYFRSKCTLRGFAVRNFKCDHDHLNDSEDTDAVGCSYMVISLKKVREKKKVTLTKNAMDLTVANFLDYFVASQLFIYIYSKYKRTLRWFDFLLVRRSVA